MNELRLVLVRHGTRAHHNKESRNNPLCSDGIREVTELAHFMKSSGVGIDDFLTSTQLHARETTNILLKNAGHADAECVDAPELEASGSLFSIDTIVQRAITNGISFDAPRTVGLVGHEGCLSNLIARMTGSRHRPLERAEAVCVEGASIHDFRLGRARLAWRIPVRAHDEKELREKLVSKMTVATLLAGFTLAALVELITGDFFARPRHAITAPVYLRFLLENLPRIALGLLTLAAALFIATAYIYDRLGMPPGFWVAGGRGPKGPRKQNPELKEYGVVYWYMTRTWLRVFTPGVGAAGVAFLLLVIDAAGLSVALACLGLFVLAGIHYWRSRPELGVD